MARKLRDDTPRSSEPHSGPEEVDAQMLVRHEEELEVGKRLGEAGKVRARKVVETSPVEQSVPVAREIVEVERLPAEADDSGRVERLPDGSLSLPIFGEEIEVRKRVVVKGRLRLGKRTVTDEETVAAELARERVQIESDPQVEVRDVGDAAGSEHG